MVRVPISRNGESSRSRVNNACPLSSYISGSESAVRCDCQHQQKWEYPQYRSALDAEASESSARIMCRDHAGSWACCSLLSSSVDKFFSTAVVITPASPIDRKYTRSLILYRLKKLRTKSTTPINMNSQSSIVTLSGEIRGFGSSCIAAIRSPENRRLISQSFGTASRDINTVVPAPGLQWKPARFATSTTFGKSDR